MMMRRVMMESMVAISKLAGNEMDLAEVWLKFLISR